MLLFVFQCYLIIPKITTVQTLPDVKPSTLNYPVPIKGIVGQVTLFIIIKGTVRV